MARGKNGKDEKGREPEYCDDCRERVGFYDPSQPEGEKIIITRICSCWQKKPKPEEMKGTELNELLRFK